MVKSAIEYETEFLSLTALEISKIPNSIKRSPNWILWQPQVKAGREKPIKKPIGGAKWQDHTQDFDTILTDYAEQQQQYPTGLGFVFNESHPYVCVDIDEMTPNNKTLQALLQSYTETSPSGTGTHVIVQLMTIEDKKKIMREFGQKKFSLSNKRDLFISSGYVTFTGNHVLGTPSLIRMLSFDELYSSLKTYFNPKVATLEPKARPQDPTVQTVKKFSTDQVRLMLRKIDVRTLTSGIFEKLSHPTELAILDPEETEEARDPWLIICQGVHHNFSGEPDGLLLLHEWSKKGNKYDKADTLAVYASFSTDPQFLNQAKPVTIASLIALISAQQPDFSDRTSKGTPLATIQNLEAYFKFYKYKMQYNLISLEAEVNMPKAVMDSLSSSTKTLTDIDTVHRIVSSELLKLGMSTSNFVSLRSSILDYAQLNTYNPIEDYFSSLVDVYDEHKDPLTELMNTIRAERTLDNPSFKKAMYWFIRKWLIQVVAAAHTSATHSERMFNNVLIFTGDQGIGKTRWVASLFPEEIKRYCAGSGSLRVHQFRSDSVKQAIELQRTLICNINEIDQLFNRKNYSAFKQMLDENTSTMVLPYGRSATTMTRRTVFIGSTNKNNFLVDQTGNRRITIIPAADLDFQHNVNLKQLWAHAVFWYNQGEKWWLDKDDDEEAAAIALQIQLNNRTMFLGDENLLEDLDLYFDLSAKKRQYKRVTFKAIRNAVPSLAQQQVNSRMFNASKDTFTNWLKLTKYGEVCPKTKGSRVAQYYIVPPLVSGAPLATFRQTRSE